MYHQPENIERSIFEAVRLRAVSMGFWVDETLITSVAQFKEAVDELVTPIEIIGVGDYRARGEKPKNCIVIDFDGGGSGDVGGIGRIVYEKITGPTPQDYRVFGTPTQSENLTFSVRLIAENTKNRRIAERIIRASLPRKKYLFGINENGTSTENGFWCFGGIFTDISKGGEYGIERMFSYTVANVFLEEPQDLGVVRPLIEINVGVEPQDLR